MKLKLYTIILLFFLAIIGIVIIISIVQVFWEQSKFDEEQYNDCLKEIAIRECELRGLLYSSHYAGFTKFCCKKDLRALEKEELKFFDSEIENCKLKSKK